MPGVRGTSGGRDGKEEKMATSAPRLMLMSGSLGRRASPIRTQRASNLIGAGAAQ
jgi:hypothetical protein